MTKQIAFLRGINVGNIRIKMPDLQAAFEKVGCQNVKTYLQTGNVVFESNLGLEELKLILEHTLTQTFHYEAFVLLYSFDSLVEIIANYPFERTETHHAYAIFIENEAILEELSTHSQGLEEDMATGKKVLYWKVTKGQSTDTAFSKLLAKAKYKPYTTVRNLNTLEKMGSPDRL